jgi:hypothetical protein
LAGPALLAAARQPPSLEAARRMQQLLAKLDLASPSRLGALRGIELLEHVATPEALRVLRTLAEGAPQALQTQEAQAALRRLTRATGRN